METIIPVWNIVAMAFSALVGIGVPAVLYVVYRKKGANHLPFWIGCITFVLFAFVLERLALSLVMKLPLWTSITNNLFVYGIVAGLFAGVFEETGRFVAFKTVLRKKRGNDHNALMYGAGHGGIEAILLLSVTMIVNTIFAVQFNAGIDSSFGGISVAQTLINIPFWMLLVGAVERLAAITIHLSLSVLVWFAAKNGKRFWLFPLAILLHLFVDAVAVILSGAGVNVLVIEGAVYVIAIAFVILAVAVWKKNHTAQAEETPAEDAPVEAVAETAEDAPKTETQM
jgi:uncharacterized membrane protein YhfC